MPPLLKDVLWLGHWKTFECSSVLNFRFVSSYSQPHPFKSHFQNNLYLFALSIWETLRSAVWWWMSYSYAEKEILFIEFKVFFTSKNQRIVVTALIRGRQLLVPLKKLVLAFDWPLNEIRKIFYNVFRNNAFILICVYTY